MRKLCTWMLQGSLISGAALLATSTSAHAQRPTSSRTRIVTESYVLPAQEPRRVIILERDDQMALPVQLQEPPTPTAFRDDFSELGIVTYSQSNLNSWRRQHSDALKYEEHRMPGAIIRFSF